MKEKPLSSNQKTFCNELIFDWNQTRAYKVAYPSVNKDSAAASCANKLLKIAKIQAYIEELQSDLVKLTGLTKIKILREHEKLSFTGMANLHNTWIDRKKFEELTKEEKDCISEITTRVRTEIVNKKAFEIEEIKIKLYDKQKSLEAIAKMLGHNEPKKIDITTKGKEMNSISSIREAFGLDAVKNPLNGSDT